MGTTTKHGLPFPDGTDLITDGDDAIADLAGDLDAIIATDDQGLLASRPTSTGGTPGKSGRYYTDENGTTWRDYGTGWRLAGGRLPRSNLVRTSSAPTSTDVDVSWDVAVEDTSMWSSGTDITVPYFGVYLIELVASWDSSAVGSRRSVIVLNGAARRHSHAPGMAIAGYWAPTLTASLRLDAGDVIRGRLWQDSGGSLGYVAEMAVTMISA